MTNERERIAQEAVSPARAWPSMMWPFPRRDREAEGVGKQAIELAMQHGYTGIALVRFSVVGKHCVPTVHALTPEQEDQIKRYLAIS